MSLPRLATRLSLVALAVVTFASCGKDVVAGCKSFADCAITSECVNGACVPKMNVIPGCTQETNEAFCTRTNNHCGMVSLADNCGSQRTVDCGQCVSPQTCNMGTCGACVPETDAALCSAQHFNCGNVTLTDRCGVVRTVSCGACTGHEACGGGGKPNECGGCAPESDADFCRTNGKDCGSYSGKDRCNRDRSANCGSPICSGASTCGGGGVPNVCACGAETNAQFCVRLGKNCDTVTGSDNCGVSRTVNCGACAGGAQCGGDGVSNVCSGCTPQTDAAFCTAQGKNCGQFTGNDNCGRSRTAMCGQCMGRETCGAAGLNVCGCIPQSDATFCAGLLASCGVQTAMDNCGVARTRDCGTCLAPTMCVTGAVQSSCACMPETDDALCTRLGKSCDVVNAFDNCGATRSVNCGVCRDGRVCGAGGIPGVCGPLPVPDAGPTGGGGGGGGTGGGGGSTGGGGGSTGGGGGSNPQCSSDRLRFSAQYQPVPHTEFVVSSNAAWFFRCAGTIPDGGAGCHSIGNTPSVDLGYLDETEWKLIDSPIPGPTGFGWRVTPGDAGVPKDYSGGKLFCQALGYSGAQVFANTAAAAGTNWAFIQTNPTMWGQQLDGGSLPYAEPVYDIDCTCTP